MNKDKTKDSTFDFILNLSDIFSFLLIKYSTLYL